MTEIRHALRRLRATPVVTLSLFACLSIGVWMTCVVSAVAFGIFRPNLHLPEANRIVQFDERGLYGYDPLWNPFCCGRQASRGVVDALASQPMFTAVGFYQTSFANIQGYQGLATTTRLSAGMMGVLRVPPLLGRGFIPSDDTVGGVAILSYTLWQKLYESDPAVVGRSIRLDRENPRTIIGVMPESFLFPRGWRRPDLYVPFDGPRGWSLEYPSRTMLARLADGVDRDDAEQAARTIALRTVASDRAQALEWWRTMRKKRPLPELPRGGIDARLERYRVEPRGSGLVSLIVVILGCGMAVVAIAATNVANLLLIRGASRRQEIAVRMAMGATRVRVIGELVLETLLLAVPAVAVGFALAAKQWALLDPAYSERQYFGEMDLRVAAMAIGGGLTLVLFAGVWPGLRATAFNLEQVLRDSRRSGVSGSPLDGLLGRLVAGATGATVMLMICAVLLGLSARDKMNEMMAPAGLLTAELVFDQSSGAIPERVALARATLGRLRALPGVWRAGLGSGVDASLKVSHSGEPQTRMGAVEVVTVSEGYFETRGIRLLRGRAFSAREARDSSGMVVVSRALAQRLFPGGNGVGERFRYMSLDDSVVVDAQVIGVVENTIDGSNGNGVQLYLPMGSRPLVSTSAFVQYRRGWPPQPADVAKTLRGASGISATKVVSIAERLRRESPFIHYIRLGFGMFATVGLVLAIVGTYGVVTYSVLRRTHEIGVRMALGAEGATVTRMVIEHGVRITLVGVAIGGLLSIAAMRVLGGMVMDVNMNYPSTIAGVICFVCLLSIIASAIPAFRAGRLNPVDALRAD